MVLGPLFLDGVIIAADIATGAAFLSVLKRLRSTGSAEGLSLQTLVAAVSVRAIHLYSHHIGLHYRPEVLPSVAYLVLDCLTALAGLACLVTLLMHFDTYESQKDNFGIQVFDSPRCLGGRVTCRKYRWLGAAAFLYSLAAFLAVGWHHVRNVAVYESLQSSKTSFYMSFYEVMAALCLLPQLWMFHQDRRVPPLLANLVTWLAAHKMLVLAFWVAYPYIIGLEPPNRKLQICFDTLSLLILADFLYYWARSKLRGYDEVVIGEVELYPPSSKWREEWSTGEDGAYFSNM